MLGLDPVDTFDFHWLPFHRSLSPQTVIQGHYTTWAEGAAEQKCLWESLIPLARNQKLKEPLQTLTERKNSSLPSRGGQKTLFVSIDQNTCRGRKFLDSIQGSSIALCLDSSKWFEFSMLFQNSNKTTYPPHRTEASSMFLTHSQLLKWTVLQKCRVPLFRFYFLKKKLILSISWGFFARQEQLWMQNQLLCLEVGLRLLPHAYMYMVFLHLPQHIPRAYEQVSRTHAK